MKNAKIITVIIVGFATTLALILYSSAPKYSTHTMPRTVDANKVAGSLVMQDDIYLKTGNTVMLRTCKYDKNLEWEDIPRPKIIYLVDGKKVKGSQITGPEAGKAVEISVIWSKGNNDPQNPDDKFYAVGH